MYEINKNQNNREYKRGDRMIENKKPGGQPGEQRQYNGIIAKTDNLSNLKAALSLAKRGFFIFPLENRGKRPQKNIMWKDVSTIEIPTITRWWQKWPDANIGIDCGKSDLLIIDVDPPHGGECKDLHLSKEESATPIVATGGGGYHIFYHQPNLKLGNSTGDLPSGIDIRGVGGYVVGVGSIHPSGVVYQWCEGGSPDDREIKSCPKSIIEKIKGVFEKKLLPPPPDSHRHNGNDLYVEAAIQRELSILKCASAGSRNDQLNKSSFAIGTLLAAATGQVSEKTIYNQLYRIGETIGLKRGEIGKTISSGLNSGKMSPRDLSRVGTKKEKEEKKIEQVDISKVLGEDLSDEFFARLFVKKMGDNLLYTEEMGFLEYGDGFWRRITKSKTHNLLNGFGDYLIDRYKIRDDERYETIRKLCYSLCNTRRKSSILVQSTAVEGVAKKIEEFDDNPRILNVRNGSVDLSTARVSPHKKENYLTKITDIELSTAAECPLWLKFLDTIFEGDTELIDYIQKAVGYSLSGETGEQCLFFLFGNGRNGKSVFSKILMSLCGGYGQKAPKSLLSPVNEGQSNEVARLRGVRLAVCSEVETGQKWSESQIKDLTGEDIISARFLYHEFFDFQPSHKMWIYGNHKPDIRGTDLGIWRRIRLIPFLYEIPTYEVDTSLYRKLLEELPGILKWAVLGAKKWYCEGLTPIPKCVSFHTEQYKNEQDTIGAFLEEKCFISIKARDRQCGLIYQSYREWSFENGYQPLGNRRFGRELEGKGYKRVNPKPYKAEWVNIGLTPAPV